MIRLAHPRIPESVTALFAEVLNSGHLTGGPMVTRLEGFLEQRFPGTTVLAVANGTMASLVAFHVLKDRGIQRVIAPDFCYPSVVSSALILGLDVFLADIDPHRFRLHSSGFDALPADQHTVVLSVDAFGIPGHTPSLMDIIAKKGWPWLEDSACALGSSRNSIPCGLEADVALLSFHPRKPLTTAEGGALILRDPTMAEHARMVAHQGVSGTGIHRRFERLGYNARQSELHAALGIAQLEQLDAALSHRRTLGQTYLSALEKFQEVAVPDGFRDPGANFQSMVIRLPQDVHREHLVARMTGDGIETTRAGYALHTQPAYSSCVPLGPLVHSLSWHHRGLALPLHEQMAVEDVHRVVNALGKALNDTHCRRAGTGGLEREV